MYSADQPAASRIDAFPGDPSISASMLRHPSAPLRARLVAAVLAQRFGEVLPQVPHADLHAKLPAHVVTAAGLVADTVLAALADAVSDGALEAA